MALHRVTLYAQVFNPQLPAILDYGKRALYADDAVLSFATDSIVLSFEKPSASALDSTPPTNTEERDKD